MFDIDDIDFTDSGSVDDAVQILEEEIDSITAQIDDNSVWLNSAANARKIKRRQIERLRRTAGQIEKERNSTKEWFMKAAKEALGPDLYDEILVRARLLNCVNP